MPHRAKLRPSPPAPTGGLLRAASRLYLSSFRSCVALALIGTLLSAAIGAYASTRLDAFSRAVSGMFSGSLNAGVGTADNAVADFGDMIVRAQALLHSPGIWASMLGSALIVLVFHGALIAQQDAVAQARAAPLGEALSGTLRRLPSVLLALMLFIAAAAIGLLLLRIAHAAGAVADTLIGLGLSIAAVWLWGRLQLWLAAMFIEQTGAAQAISSSWTIVRGNWWRASALTTVPYIVIFALSSAGELAASLAGGALGAHATAGRSALVEVLSMAIGVITLPMLPVVWLGLYRTLSVPDPAARRVASMR
ncbi:MAG: hypothetical protein ACREU2_13295 [Steroidobacteraceae bacterium]